MTELERALREKLISDTVRDLLTSPGGREFLWELLTISKWNTQPFSTDPQITAFNCGELNIGNQIIGLIIAADEAGLITLMKEKYDASRRTVATAASGSDSTAGTAPGH